MKRVVLSLFFLSFLSSASPMAETVPNLHKPQLYDFNGDPVDPLCFLNNIGTEDAPVYPTQNCQYEEIVNVGQSGIDEDKYVAVSFEESFYDVETDESTSSFGIVGYRAIGTMTDSDGQDYMALAVIENGGGSGVFSTVMLVEPIIDEAEKTINYRRHRALSFGDRCTGGFKEGWIDENGELYYRVYATMGDMFGLVGDPEREILYNGPANSLPYCANCCYAEAEFSSEEFRGVLFPADRWQPYESDDGEETAASCVENLVALNVTQGGKNYFGKEDFESFIRELEHVCLGRVEGE